jgi:hypothetical protein
LVRGDGSSIFAHELLGCFEGQKHAKTHMDPPVISHIRFGKWFIDGEFCRYLPLKIGDVPVSKP